MYGAEGLMDESRIDDCSSYLFRLDVLNRRVLLGYSTKNADPGKFMCTDTAAEVYRPGLLSRAVLIPDNADDW